MIAEFAAPLKQMLRPDNHRYQEPAQTSEMPTPAQLTSQLEGLWPGIDKLSHNRQRAIHQLMSRIRRFKAHDNKWSFLTLGATAPVDAEGDMADDASKPIKPTDTPLEAAALHFDAESLALINEASSQHAYTATVCLALIKKAKDTSGILPSSDFLWTRSKDVQFWRMINGYGRPGHNPQIMGAFAHFHLETRQKKALTETFFDQASFIAD